jgi:hypothetical protein
VVGVGNSWFHPSPITVAVVRRRDACTANNFGIMYSRTRTGQNSFPYLIYIFPKSFLIFCQELQDPKRNYEYQI